MTDEGKVTCPQARRVITRRAETGKWRRDPRWKKVLEEHAYIPEAECSVCHRKHKQHYVKRTGDEKIISLTINHTNRACYLDEDLYLTWNPANMRVECTTCNWMYEKGMIPCPECLKNGFVTYIRWDAGECDTCYFEKHPEVLERINQKRTEQAKSLREFKAARAEKRRKAKVRHPCSLHRIGGKCGKSTIGSRCTYAPTKAKNCPDAKMKK